MEHAPDPIAAIALLDEPTRRRLYEFVAASADAVARDEAAAGIGIARELAAFHLDRLADAGLLDVEFRRRSGRTGPGAGRPAKLYRRANREVVASVPERHYEAAASMLAEAVERIHDPGAILALREVARSHGESVGASATSPTPGTDQWAALSAMLAEAGFQPEPEPLDGLGLRNCPYRILSEQHRDVICGMNLAWAEGLITGADGAMVQAELRPREGGCCVVFRSAGVEPPSA